MTEPRGLLRSLDSPAVVPQRIRWLLGALMVPFVALTFWLCSHGNVRLGPFLPFVSAHAMAMFIVSGITSILLFNQAAVTQRRAYAVLGATYEAVAMILVVFPLVFPDALRSGAILGGPQSPVNLYYLWHLVFTFGILSGSLLYWLDHARLRRPGLAVSVRGWVLGTFVVVGGLLAVDLWFPERLPVLMSDSIGGTMLMHIADWTLLVLSVLTCAVTLALARRGSLMSIYLAAVGVSLLGLGIVNTSTSDRYTLGWYAIRGFSLAAMSVLLVMLIWALSRIDRASVEQLERDTLTGVLRRLHFQDLLTFELERMRAGHGTGALLWIDLDAFKTINDRLGHTAGDEMLALVGQRLLETAGNADLVGRVGGDEFCVLGVGVTPTGAHELAERLRLALREPYPIEPAPALLTAAIGIAVVDSPVPDAQTLLRQADLAAYRSKVAGGDQVAEYTSSIEDEVRHRAEMRAELAEALRNGSFDLDYQPIIATRTGEVAGLEALVRWQRGSRRIPAKEFIATIEETGQVRQMGLQVLAILNRDSPQLLEALPEGAFISVNLSVSELAGAKLWVPLLQGPLGAKPSCFVLEVTETADLIPGTPADLALAALRGAGYALAVDDFGTGYSNFDRLEALSPTILKLDRSVIDRASAGQPTALHFLAASVSIGHDMGALVLVEGVETSAQLQLVSDLGADLVQGWFFSKALQLRPALAYLRDAESRLAAVPL